MVVEAGSHHLSGASSASGRPPRPPPKACGGGRKWQMHLKSVSLLKYDGKNQAVRAHFIIVVCEEFNRSVELSRHTHTHERTRAHSDRDGLLLLPQIRLGGQALVQVRDLMASLAAS